MVRKTIIASLAVLAASTGSAAACTIPDGWTAMQSEQPQSLKVALKLPPIPIKIGKPFSIDILMCTDQDPGTDDIRLDAVMPAHKHGMNYRPEIKPLANNVYRGTGMFFHMPGEWQISVNVLSDGKTLRFLLKVPAG